MERLYKILPYLYVVIGVFSSQQWLEITVSNQYLVWGSEAIILGTFLVLGLRSRRVRAYRIPWQIGLFLLMVLCSSFYGLFMAEGYWDFKMLVTNALIYFLPLGYCYYIQPSKVSAALRIWMLFSVVLFWVLLPFMQGECVGKFLLPFSFLLLVCPYFDRRPLILVLAFSAIVMVAGTFGARSTFLRFAVCLIIALAVWLRRYVPKSVIASVVIAEFLLPFLLLVLGLTGVFNVFKIGDYIGANGVEVQNSYDSSETEDLGLDTRTFLYVEEIASAIKNNYVIQGRSLSRGYDSDYFGTSDLEMMGRGERASSEVSILNVFNYFGVVGVFVYLTVFIGAVFSVFRHSRNKFMYFMAVFVGYKWLWAFVEDFTMFDMNNILMWVAISMCFSPFFLEMDDYQIARWANNLIKF